LGARHRPGIPPEVLPKIFQPYFTTKGPRQGTGLGLNIVQRLIKEGNGALHVHTQPAKARRSRFICRF
jgi:signal transduction histidine kinase